MCSTSVNIVREFSFQPATDDVVSATIQVLFSSESICNMLERKKDPRESVCVFECVCAVCVRIICCRTAALAPFYEHFTPEALIKVKLQQAQNQTEWKNPEREGREMS